MAVIVPFFFFLLVLLSGCSGPIDTGPGLGTISNQFSEAMRWQDYVGAGRSLQKDVRGAFLEQFQRDEDLHVVESRIISIELNTETGTAEADYRLKFYRLPSLRVQKWQWLQHWQLSRQKALKSNTWLIVNAPPPLP